MKDFITEKFKPQRLASQEEFDRCMQEINIAQADLPKVLRDQLDRVSRKVNGWKMEIFNLKAKIAQEQAARAELEMELREINSTFHKVKHELIELNPIDSWEKKEGEDNGTQTEN